MMQTNELDAWLGPARDDLTDDQHDRLTREARDIAARYPGEDDEAERDAALSAAVQYLLGETTLAEQATVLASARIAASRALAGARQVARMAALDGTPKATAAREAGIDRMTLLTDLGERPRRAPR